MEERLFHALQQILNIQLEALENMEGQKLLVGVEI
jgi:hypothetical protein